MYTQYQLDKVSDPNVTLADYTNGMDFSILGNIDNNTLNTPDFEGKVKNIEGYFDNLLDSDYFEGIARIMQQQIQAQIQMQQAFNFGNFTIDGKMYNATNDFSSLYGNWSMGNMSLGNMSLGNMSMGNMSNNGNMSFGNMSYGNMSYINYTQRVETITIDFFFDSFNSQP